MNIYFIFNLLYFSLFTLRKFFPLFHSLISQTTCFYFCSRCSFELHCLKNITSPLFVFFSLYSFFPFFFVGKLPFRVGRGIKLPRRVGERDNIKKFRKINFNNILHKKCHFFLKTFFNISDQISQIYIVKIINISFLQF